MKFKVVSRQNIRKLFSLNKELATEEGQEELFTATLKDYSKGFIGRKAPSKAVLCFNENNLIGLVVFNYRFATYIGSKTLYIEDIYLKKDFQSEENKKGLLEYILATGRKENCKRIEMRVLKDSDMWEYSIKELGFKEIQKWSVYRLNQ